MSANVLFFDPVSRRATALVRMETCSRYGPHRYAEAEELYGLEGFASAEAMNNDRRSLSSLRCRHSPCA